MMRDYKKVGKVVSLTRFPVKAMAGEDIEEVNAGWHGLAKDRTFSFMVTNNKTGFPWLTAREMPELVRYRPYLTNPANVRESDIRVITPDGKDLAIESPELLEELTQKSGKQIQLLQNWSGIFDAMDVSIMSIESRKSLESIVGSELDSRRFRANITIETLPYVTRDFPEDKFIGCLLKFGEHSDSARVRVKRKDIRCMVVNINPSTAKQDPIVLKKIVSERRNLVGVYGTVERPGIIKVGDSIFISK